MRLVPPTFVLALTVGCGAPAAQQCPPMQGGMHGMHGDMHGSHGAVHDSHGEGMQHDFSDVARFEAMFEAPERPAWQHPVEVVSMLGVERGQTVVDLGTGTGYFLPFLAIAVGEGGHVLALDTEPAMIEYVRARVDREQLGVVEARVVAPEDPGLPSESVDHILIVDTWHHLPARATYAAALRAALRPGGSVVVIDFTTEATQGPPVADRIEPETVALELTNAGFAAAVLEEHLPDQYAVRGRLP